jgi:predicted alpha/beta-hydrolase family hydrolase
MLRLAALLEGIGVVRAFDYPYMQRQGRKAPDKLEVLVAAHRGEVERLRAQTSPPEQLVLAGKSMGGRVGCHVALESAVSGCVCFGYPLRGQSGKLRDQVLLELRVPVLFVQGTRDELCDLGELEAVRLRMTARSELYVVDGGDHSLVVTKTRLKASGKTDSAVDLEIASAVRRFCESLHGPEASPAVPPSPPKPPNAALFSKLT